MGAPWPSEEARERYIRFLELELRLMECASSETVDPDLLRELNSLLKSGFPRTMAYVEKKRTVDIADLVSGEMRTIAWAEARALRDGTWQARVAGAWTESEIAEDINECFRTALERLGR